MERNLYKDIVGHFGRDKNEVLVIEKEYNLLYANEDDRLDRDSEEVAQAIHDLILNYDVNVFMLKSARDGEETDDTVKIVWRLWK